MIELLRISSYAIFDEVSIEFGDGLNCMTGETGAGKSLIIGALTQLMGARTNADVVRNGSDKAVIEALFVEGEDEFVVRREIAANGRSRCYINGSLATVAQLSEITKRHIHIYGQHQYQDLLNSREHMTILERLAGLDRSAIEGLYDVYREKSARLDDLSDEIERGLQEQDQLRFDLTEIDAAAVYVGQEADLEAELTIARSAVELKDGSQRALGMLYRDSNSVTDLMAGVQQLIQGLALKDVQLEPLVESAHEVMGIIEDMHLRLDRSSEAYETDPQKQEELEERLYVLRGLKRKHSTDEAGLLGLAENLRQRVGLLDDSSGALEKLREEREHAWEAYIAAVGKFLEQRLAFADDFRLRINSDLADLGMQGADFSVTSSAVLGQVDRAHASPAALLGGEFMIATNLGQPSLPLAKIASGGELSRIMLAIKSQQKVAHTTAMIFDEIDAGISGQTALMVAEKLKSIGSRSQSIVITHLHQVAAAADQHFTITKHQQQGNTVSCVTPISYDERVGELARMMGGENPDPSVVEHARALLGSS